VERKMIQLKIKDFLLCFSVVIFNFSGKKEIFELLNQSFDRELQRQRIENLQRLF
jgi:hypothetical protein